MEDLNKNQIILLALLVSFVGSVATSIMTYSLLVEAPPTVTQTVNRVVERTVETIVPQQTRDVVTREVTVVVQEEDLVIEAIANNEPSLVRIFRVSGEEKVFVGLGLLLDKDGLIATGKLDTAGGLFFEAVLPDGSISKINSTLNTTHFSFFKTEQVPGDSVMKPAVLANSDSLQLGQTVIAMRGDSKTSVSIGRILSLSRNEEGAVSKFSSIETDIFNNESLSPIVNLKGEVVGLNSIGGSIFIPINVLKAERGN